MWLLRIFWKKLFSSRERQYGALERVQALGLNDTLMPDICLPTVFCVAIDILLTRTLVENNTY